MVDENHNAFYHVFMTNDILQTVMEAGWCSMPISISSLEPIGGYATEGQKAVTAQPLRIKAY